MKNSNNRWLTCALALGTFLFPSALLAAESTGAYVDDAAITSKVKTDILADEGLKAATDISVETTHHVVTLTGTVKSRSEATEAQRVATAVDGVRSVKNDIAVRSY